MRDEISGPASSNGVAGYPLRLESAMAISLRAFVICALTLLPAWSLSQQQDMTEIAAPQLQVGDEWQYEVVNLWQGGHISDQTTRVVAVDGHEAILQYE